MSPQASLGCCDSFSDPFLVFHTHWSGTVWSVLQQECVWGMILQEEDQRSQPLMSSHTKDTWTHRVDVACDHLANVVFARFLHCEVILLPSFHTVPLWKEFTMHRQYLRNGELRSTSSRSVYITYMDFFYIGDVSFLPPLP